ncbi:CD59 glycoprotein [Orussus abietinus]|uniref:CD59 glycoprotein n=1 Tax=Orussus abietinus TaxID=222816 RepID=UPI0006269CF1|nr:CD59 glycoprotein [Orussus abietinus]
MAKCLVVILSILYFCYLGNALECYVCTNQEDNKEKCIKSIKTCEQGEDVCLTEIAWGSTPYWSQGTKKQYYISKRCSTKKNCERVRRNNMPDCTHIWYQDWKCSECCKGDRCNYYIISGSGRTGICLVTILAVLLPMFHWSIQ